MAKVMKMRVKGRHRRWGCRCCFWCSRVGDLRVWVAWFHFLRNCPKERTGETDFVWGCCWHRSTSAMWVFKSSYLISFWFAGMAAAHIFHKLVISAHPFMKMTSWGYCVIVHNCSGEPFFCPDISGTSWIDSVVIRVWNCCSHFGGGCPERGFLGKDLSRLLLRVIYSLIYIVDLFLGQWFVILVFAGDA